MVCVPPREKGKNGRVKNWIRCNAMGREGRGETKRERETKFPFLRTRLLCSRTHRTAAVAAMCVVVVVVVVKKTRAFHPLEQRRRQRQSRWKGGRERWNARRRESLVSKRERETTTTTTLCLPPPHPIPLFRPFHVCVCTLYVCDHVTNRPPATGSFFFSGTCNNNNNKMGALVGLLRARALLMSKIPCGSRPTNARGGIVVVVVVVDGRCCIISP